MNINNNQFLSIEQVTGQYLKRFQTNQSSVDANKTPEGLTFDQVLNKNKLVKEQAELKFSKHANERLVNRNIDLSVSQLERLEAGTEKARAKGIKESLVMIDDLSFIVNTKNNTVITAVNNDEEKIFTNIDGAVII